MEVFNYREFAPQDFSAINNQSIFTVDTATIPKNIRNTIADELGSERLIIADSAASISKQQIETFLTHCAKPNQLDKNQDGIVENTGTIDILSHGSTGCLQLGNKEINSNTLDNYKNDQTDWTHSSQTADVLMPGHQVSTGEESHRLVEQLTSLTESTSLSAPNTLNLLKNSGFDKALDGTNWLLGKTGKVKDYDQNIERVAHIDNVQGQGRQMYLKLPEEAKINYDDQLSLFQDVAGLKTDKVYAVEARVKWLNPENNLPSAIVSFWAKNPDSSYQGQDFVLTDGDSYKKLRFEFTPTEIGTTRFFLGLFPHISGNTDDTQVYVDDYKLSEIGDVPKNLDSRKGNLLSDGGFDKYTAQPKAKTSDEGGWTYTVESPVPGLKQSVPTLINGDKKLRLELPKAENGKDDFNKSVTGVYQNVNLVGGQTYKISADFNRTALNKFAAYENSIVQLITYRQRNNGEELFLGPIDIELTTNGLLSKNFNIIAPDSGNYTVLVRLAGWGNEGNGVVVDVDNVSLAVK